MLNRGYWVTTGLSVVGLAIVTERHDEPAPTRSAPSECRRGSGSSVRASSASRRVAFVYITQYYTAGWFRPVREIAEASQTGPATNIIAARRSASRRPS